MPRHRGAPYPTRQKPDPGPPGAPGRAWRRRTAPDPRGACAVVLELVIVPRVHPVADPVVRAAGRGARAPVSGQIELRAARLRGLAVDAHRAAIADVQVGLAADRSRQPEVADDVAEGGTVQGEL